MKHKNECICIVEGDKDINELFKSFLEFSGYKVDAFINALEAISSFKENRYDLVLLELNFSEMNGITVYKTLKAIDDKVLILIVTADLSSAELIKEIIPDIKDNILYKPVPLYDLKRKIESNLFLS